MTDPNTIPEFDAAALVLIDTQRDVLDGGSLPIPGTSAALPAMCRLLDGFRDAERPIVHVVRLYEQDGSNADLSRRGALAAGARILVRDTPGCEVAAQLLPDPAVQLDAARLLQGDMQPLAPLEVAMYKPRWGAFYETPLEQHLRAHGVSTVVFAGCNFPNCPRTSIYEASERDFRVVAVRDAISGMYDRGERELAGIGVILMTAQEVEDALASSGEPDPGRPTGRRRARVRR
jgi:nicotinamidase-related amidase